MPESQPTLADLPALVDRARQAGLHVAFTTRGAQEELSPGLELAVYRVVQEALTNVAKHAPASRATVTVTRDADGIEVEVANTLSATAARVAVRQPHEPRSGHGLRGMTERVGLYGGQLEATADTDRFRVSARFPITEVRRERR